jgi:hypothetical protein
LSASFGSAPTSEASTMSPALNFVLPPALAMIT